MDSPTTYTQLLKPDAESCLLEYARYLDETLGDIDQATHALDQKMRWIEFKYWLPNLFGLFVEKREQEVQAAQETCRALIMHRHNEVYQTGRALSSKHLDSYTQSTAWKLFFYAIEDLTERLNRFIDHTGLAASLLGVRARSKVGNVAPLGEFLELEKAPPHYESFEELDVSDDKASRRNQLYFSSANPLVVNTQGKCQSQSNLNIEGEEVNRAQTPKASPEPSSPSSRNLLYPLSL